MSHLYLVERRLDEHTAPFWEISKAVPRNADGEPVEHGDLGFDGSFYGEVLGQVASIEIATRLIKERTKHDIRVSDVTRAYEAAEARGPVLDRRIKARPRKDDAIKAVDGMGGYTSGTPSRGAPPRKYTPPPRSSGSLRYFLIGLVILILLSMAYRYFGTTFLNFE